MIKQEMEVQSFGLMAFKTELYKLTEQLPIPLSTSAHNEAKPSSVRCQKTKYKSTHNGGQVDYP